jgi:lipopolysaccharide/colanic/teichoic acid biosynthesis glycosyltransferase
MPGPVLEQKTYLQLTRRQRVYIKVKRVMDVLLSGAGLVVLSPLFLGVILAIKLEDGWRAPVFFSQKRVGNHKCYFQLYKFRSMKLDAPHDMPTHLLRDPEQYITKVGKVLRRTSLDELPQIWNILKGDMSVIGPRPALWNQEDLLAERDKYGANDVAPGLTGWAQINGRDELEIDVKARFDGEYVEKLSFLFDVRCFFGTILHVLRSDGVVEGGTGTKEEK